MFPCDFVESGAAAPHSKTRAPNMLSGRTARFWTAAVLCLGRIAHDHPHDRVIDRVRCSQRVDVNFGFGPVRHTRAQAPRDDLQERLQVGWPFRWRPWEMGSWRFKVTPGMASDN